MNKNPRSRRALSLLGSLMLADGSSFLLDGPAQIALWSGKHAPAWYRKVMAFFGNHVALCRALAAAEVVAGATILRRSSRR